MKLFREQNLCKRNYIKNLIKNFKRMMKVIIWKNNFWWKNLFQFIFTPINRQLTWHLQTLTQSTQQTFPSIYTATISFGNKLKLAHKAFRKVLFFFSRKVLKFLFSKWIFALLRMLLFVEKEGIINRVNYCFFTEPFHVFLCFGNIHQQIRNYTFDNDFLTIIFRNFNWSYRF